MAAPQKLPSGHCEAALALPAAVVPAAVGTQVAEPALGWKVSGGQPAGDDEPATHMVPGGQAVPVGGVGTAATAPPVHA